MQTEVTSSLQRDKSLNLLKQESQSKASFIYGCGNLNFHVVAVSSVTQTP